MGKALTKEEAIHRHRLMWEWIAEESELCGRPITKREAFDHFGWESDDVLARCWCCEYSRSVTVNQNTIHMRIRTSDLRCRDRCPVRWPNGCCTSHRSDYVIRLNGANNIGLYDEYVDACIDNNYMLCSEIARKIANLPER